MFTHIQLDGSAPHVSRDSYLDVLAPLRSIVADSVPGDVTRLTNGRDAMIVLCRVDPSFLDQ